MAVVRYTENPDPKKASVHQRLLEATGPGPWRRVAWIRVLDNEGEPEEGDQFYFGMHYHPESKQTIVGIYNTSHEILGAYDHDPTDKYPSIREVMEYSGLNPITHCIAGYAKRAPITEDNAHGKAIGIWLIGRPLCEPDILAQPVTVLGLWFSQFEGFFVNNRRIVQLNLANVGHIIGAEKIGRPPQIVDLLTLPSVQAKQKEEPYTIDVSYYYQRLI